MSGDVQVRFCERPRVKLPRATHLVLLTPKYPDRELQWLNHIMNRLGLTLHATKTRVLDANKADFVFLGHRLRWRHGQLYLDAVGARAESIVSG